MTSRKPKDYIISLIESVSEISGNGANLLI